jgi:uncharacterized protein (DUF1330 family)
MTQPAFLFIRAKIHDRQRFQQYADATAALVDRMGGKYRVMGGNPELLEGEWNPEWRIVISEWQSRAQALAFWRSPEYAAIKPLREGIAEATVILLDGLPLS